MAPRWSDQDIQYLHDKAGIVSTVRLARNLGRTPHAICNKMTSCRISVFDNFYSARLLASELGSCKHTVMRWYRLGYLKGRRADWRRGRIPMIFQEKDIVVFLKKYGYLLRKNKIPNIYFRNVVRESCLAGAK